jgi:molybdate transport system ATP-binding protein
MSEAGILRAAFKATLGQFNLDAAFSAPASGVTALFGPSGCGKTSVLRCIAGLQRVPQGHFAIEGDVWQEQARFRPAHARPLGYVFQEPSLFPHLPVTANLLYAMRGRRPSPPRDRIGFDEVVDLLGLAPLLSRAPHHLSGGERQRVAIGRALLSQPTLLLMDEPLSALDREAREEVLVFLERLHACLSLPIIYVSHDFREVERLADHLVLMAGGKVIASGQLSALQSDLGLPLATSREASVVLEGVVTSYDERYGLAVLCVEGGAFMVPMAPPVCGTTRRLIVDAGQVSISLEKPGGSTMLNALPARIEAITAHGGQEAVVALALGEHGGGVTLLARVTRLSADRLALAVGMGVYAQVKSVALL